MQFYKADVKFKVKGKPVQFSVIHNLPDVFGLSFDNALDNWIVRTKEYTAESLCQYIMSKQTDHVAMTEEQFERLKKLGK